MLDETVLHTLKCPHCGSTGPFKIVASFIINNSATFLFRNSNIVWNNDSEINCGCGQISRIFDFLTNYHQLIPQQCQLKSVDERNHELQNCLAALVSCYTFEDITGMHHSGSVLPLKRAINTLGLTDPFQKQDLENCYFFNVIDEYTDLVDNYLE